MQAERMSRRDVLVTLAITGASVFGATAANFLDQFSFDTEDFSFLSHLHESHVPMPQELKGVVINSPYLWKNDDQYIEYVLRSVQSFGANTIRFFISDEYEPSLGIYDEQVVSRIIHTVEKIKEYNAATGTHIGCIVTLFDCYSLLHSDKPNLYYGSKPLSSPYFVNGSAKDIASTQRLFFTDANVREHFINRVTTIISQFSGIPEIVAWEVANEPEFPGWNSRVEAIESLTSWYQECIDHIRSRDRKRPIITGLASPWDIDQTVFEGGNVINSVHLYPGIDGSMLSKLSRYAKTSCLPLAALELGMSQSIGGDILLPRFIRNVVASLVSDSTVWVPTYGVWKLDNYRDNHICDPNNAHLRACLVALSRQLS